MGDVMNAAAPVLHRSIASAAALRMAISALFVGFLRKRTGHTKAVIWSERDHPQSRPARHGWPTACHARTGTHPSCKLAAVGTRSGSQPVPAGSRRHNWPMASPAGHSDTMGGENVQPEGPPQPASGRCGHHMVVAGVSGGRSRREPVTPGWPRQCHSTWSPAPQFG